MQPTIVLGLLALYFFVAFIVRSLVQRARTGSAGFRGVSGAPGSLEWLGGVLFVAAIVAALAAPLAELAGAIAPLSAPAGVDRLGWLLFGTGFIFTVLAQTNMGASWRIGVDPRERTRLVTTGLFAWVRNPIFSAMLVTALGVVCLLPNVVALTASGLLLAAVELQVRFVEEPHLLRIHGPEYTRYAARVGRFVPYLGRL